MSQSPSSLPQGFDEVQQLQSLLLASQALEEEPAKTSQKEVFAVPIF